MGRLRCRRTRADSAGRGHVIRWRFSFNVLPGCHGNRRGTRLHQTTFHTSACLRLLLAAWTPAPKRPHAPATSSHVRAAVCTISEGPREPASPHTPGDVHAPPTLEGQRTRTTSGWSGGGREGGSWEGDRAGTLPLPTPDASGHLLSSVGGHTPRTRR